MQLLVIVVFAGQNENFIKDMLINIIWHFTSKVAKSLSRVFLS